MPGVWYTEDHSLGLYHMLANTRDAMWELYRICPGKSGCTCENEPWPCDEENEFSDLIGSAMTFKELVWEFGGREPLKELPL